MYVRQQHGVFNQPYQASPPNVMMTSQAPNVAVSQSWANPNTALSMDTVTINHSGAMSNLSRLNNRRQQQPTHGSGYNTCESNMLPQLSIGDLQCLDTVPQAPVMNQPESQQLFHMQHQREELVSDARVQNHLGSQNQGLQTMWSNFGTINPVQNTFNESVPGGGGGSQGMGHYPLLEGMEGSEFLKCLVGGGPQTGFQLKQEPQITVGQESHASHMQSPRETQGNTYTNLVSRPMSNGTNMDHMRQDGSGNNQSLKNLQNPYSHNGMASDGHFSTLADWIKASRHNE